MYFRRRRVNPWNKRYRRRRTRWGRRRPIRRVFRSRRRTTGGVTIVSKAQSTVVLTSANIINVQIAPKLADFNSASAMAELYENYRILSCRVKVTPNLTEAVENLDRKSPYISCPWKRAVTDASTITPDNLLSVQGSKSHPPMSKMSRTFVPAIEEVASLNGTDEGTANLTNSSIKYRPLITNLEAKSKQIQHFCGIISFPANNLVASANTMSYNILTTVKVKFYNYKTPNVK